jgi:O-antigen/teichoic acid export membrane protein
VAEGPAERAAARVARNTTTRALGEILGKLASLVLFAVLARTVGEIDLGAFVFAFAWAQIATIPVGLGFDRYILRRVARDRSSVHELFFNVLTLKLARAVPITAVSFALVSILGYDEDTRLAVYLMTAGTILDSISRTVFAVFNAFERGYLIAASVVVQRFAAAGLGLAVLAAGGGIVEVSAMFAIGTGIGLALGFVLMARSIGMPARTLPESGRTELRKSSRGYGAQDILGMLLAKIDVLILSFLATEAAVGRYGAAYRLLEATFFLTSAVNGAFAAMYAYLTRESEPSVNVAFERSIKLALAALVPCGIAFAVLAEPLSRLFFGEDLEGASRPLMLLAPVVALMGLITLGSSLLVGRREPGVLVRLAASAVIVNIALNLALIPPLDDEGAALAMLVTAVVFAGLVLREAVRTIGGVHWIAMGVGPLAGGAAMAAAMLPLDDWLAIAIPVGSLVYFAVLYLVERTTNPQDVDFIAGMIRRRLRPAREAASP